MAIGTDPASPRARNLLSRNLLSRNLLSRNLLSGPAVWAVCQAASFQRAEVVHDPGVGLNVLHGGTVLRQNLGGGCQESIRSVFKSLELSRERLENDLPLTPVWRGHPGSEYVVWRTRHTLLNGGTVTLYGEWQMVRVHPHQDLKVHQ